MGNEAWWRLYLESDQFRLEEEVMAYVAEANFIKKNIPNREVRAKMIYDIAQTFSSDLYRGIITLQDALKILR